MSNAPDAAVGDRDQRLSAIADTSSYRLRLAAEALADLLEQRREFCQLLSDISLRSHRFGDCLEQSLSRLTEAPISAVQELLEHAHMDLESRGFVSDEKRDNSILSLVQALQSVDSDPPLMNLGASAATWREEASDIHRLMKQAEELGSFMATQYNSIMEEIRDIAMKLGEAVAPDLQHNSGYRQTPF